MGAYKDTLDYLYTQLPMFQRVGPQAFKKDLTNITALCKALDQPQKQFKAIHIAGTNGKGSTAHMLSSVLQETGYSVGLYTSPHYKDFRERIKRNGKLISKKHVVDFVATHKALFEEIQPSFFEITVALAFQYFADQKVDIAIIETGLGGRLDSTNVLHPLLSIITNISLDHQQFLGDTLPEIAGEKAGIIKPGVPVIISEYQEEVATVFKEKAAAVNTTIWFADQEYQIELLANTLKYSSYSVTTNDGPQFEELKLGLTGNYQQKNLAGVLKAVEWLAANGFQISDKHTLSGLRKVAQNSRMLGRWQVIDTNPITICESAHNAGGLALLKEQLQLQSHDQLHFVFGMVNDKHPSKVIPYLPKDATYYFAKANIPRGMDAQELTTIMNAEGLKGNAYKSVKKAFKAARKQAQPNDLILIGGSIFIVAEVL